MEAKKLLEQLLDILYSKSFLVIFFSYFILYLILIVLKFYSIFLLILSLISWFGALFFELIDQYKLQNQIKISEIKIQPIGNTKVIRNLFFASSLFQLLIIGFFGLNFQDMPHIMLKYSVYHIIPIILIFSFSLFLAVWFISIQASIEFKTFKIHSVSTETIKRIFYLNFAILILGLSLFLMDCLFYIFSLNYHYLFPVYLTIPQNNSVVGYEFSISGFSFISVFFQLFSTIFSIIVIYINIKNVREDIGDQLKLKYPDIDDIEINILQKTIKNNF